MKVVQRFRHLHLIELLGTYEYRRSHCLIFLCAEDNLKTFWMNNASPNLDPNISTWVLQQCLGVAQGLQLIHNGQPSPPGQKILKGRHGDIKPANILRYAPRKKSQDPKLGVLKISDFGLTEFYGNNYHRQGYRPGATPAYRSPEGDLQHEISSLWDIWSLGCVYLEFLTWRLKGWDGVAEFTAQRTHDDSPPNPEDVGEDKFFNLIRSQSVEACVKNSVAKVRYYQKFNKYKGLHQN